MTAPFATSWQHRALVAALRLSRVNRRAAGVRAAQIDPGREPMPAHPTPPGWLTRGLRVKRSDHAGWPVWSLQRHAKVSDRVVVGVHGGGYIADILAPHWYEYATLAKRFDATVIVPLYPLAPWGRADVVVPAVADLLSELVSAHGSNSLGVLADSAGAGLALAATQELIRRGASTPARLVLISPWLDVTLSDPTSAHIDDPLLNAEGLVAAGRLWAGDLETTDPRVSPLFGTLNGMPSTAVYAGSQDLLYPDAVRLQRRAEAEGADIAFVMRDGLVHGWAGMPFLPETAAIRHQLLQQLLGV